MNEFLVWHKLKKEFVPPYRNIVFGDDGICENDLCDICRYTGLTDIKNKKIYADCSIVEFNFYNGDWIKDCGFFLFDDESLRYVVHLINEKEMVDYDRSYFDSFQIIDTIQENKLGLIK